MADDLKFSHITVTSDEDEDVVIQAGAVPGASSGGVDGTPRVARDLPAKPAPDAPSARPAEPGEPAAKATQAPVAPTASSASGASMRQAKQEGEAARKPSGQTKPANKDGYHETTLEDIESVKMPMTQKAVIAVAVVGIIAFVVYYVMNFVL